MKKSSTPFIFGRHPVVEAIRAGQNVEKVFLQQGMRGEFEKEIRALSKEFEFPITVVPKERLQKYVRSGNHQGVLAFLSLITYQKLEDILPHIYEQGETPLLLLLDGVTDVRNVGAIARSAELLGVHALVLPQKGSAQINAEAMKTSAGALAKIPVCRVKTTSQAIRQLQEMGIQVAASVLPAKQSILELDLTVPIGLVVGSEDEGVSAGVLKAVDTQFWIPQKGTLDSFNVSVAASIMLFECARQRDCMQGGLG